MDCTAAAAAMTKLQKAAAKLAIANTKAASWKFQLVLSFAQIDRRQLRKGLVAMVRNDSITCTSMSSRWGGSNDCAKFQ